MGSGASSRQGSAAPIRGVLVGRLRRRSAHDRAAVDTRNANSDQTKPLQDSQGQDAIASECLLSLPNRCITLLLTPECLGACNPILADLPVSQGRLQLQMTCREADTATRRLARHLAAVVGEHGEPDLELACARGDLEWIWPRTFQQPGGFQSHSFHLRGQSASAASAVSQRELPEEPTAELEVACPLALFALAGRHWKLARLLLQSQNPGAPFASEIERVRRTDGLRAASEGDVRTVLLLVASGLGVNDGYTFGWTILMSAVRRNQLRLVEVLLALRAQPDAVDSAGKSAADLAAFCGHSEVLQLLRRQEFSA
ncbi:unnamed protein product [Polarella glacialis]|uniref:Uncharacterized protein n=1 Tax=Polarella glacialis TaxID=89957 RepID=A0A813KSP1_POLGL|nr:unnamed protein product [Polarella glacialis]